MITIYNNFTSNRHIRKIPETDLLIWKASLIQYKKLGYRLKLYCTKEDIEFLKNEHIYDFYDEIDKDTLENSRMLSKVNGDEFWSTRKIEAIYHEVCILGNTDSVYSDIDIIMFKPLDLSKDALFWSPELQAQTGSIYLPWSQISTPKNYIMPKSILNTNDAYNCGIMWFKYKGICKYYINQYYAFAIGNPCKVKDYEDAGHNIFACNGEQRILKGVMSEKRQKVACVMDEKKVGLSEAGNHYFYFRAVWRFIPPTLDLDELIASKNERGVGALQCLNDTIQICLNIIRNYDKDMYVELLNEKSFLKNFEFERNLKPYGIVLTQYL